MSEQMSSERIGIWVMHLYVVILVGAFVAWGSWPCLGMAVFMAVCLGFYWANSRDDEDWRAAAIRRMDQEKDGSRT